MLSGTRHGSQLHDHGETRTLDLARSGSLGTVELHYNGPPVPAPPPPSL